MTTLHFRKIFAAVFVAIFAFSTNVQAAISPGAPPAQQPVNAPAIAATPTFGSTSLSTACATPLTPLSCASTSVAVFPLSAGVSGYGIQFLATNSGSFQVETSINGTTFIASNVEVGGTAPGSLSYLSLITASGQYSGLAGTKAWLAIVATVAPTAATPFSLYLSSHDSGTVIRGAVPLTATISNFPANQNVTITNPTGAPTTQPVAVQGTPSVNVANTPGVTIVGTPAFTIANPTALPTPIPTAVPNADGGAPSHITNATLPPSTVTVANQPTAAPTNADGGAPAHITNATLPPSTVTVANQPTPAATNADGGAPAHITNATLPPSTVTVANQPTALPTNADGGAPAHITNATLPPSSVTLLNTPNPVSTNALGYNNSAPNCTVAAPTAPAGGVTSLPLTCSPTNGGLNLGPLTGTLSDTSGSITAPGTSGTAARTVQYVAYPSVVNVLSSATAAPVTLGTAQSAAISLNATAFVGSVICEGSDDSGVTYYTIPCVKSDFLSYFNVATAFSGAFSSAYEAGLPGLTNIRLRVTAYTSGSLTVRLTPSALAPITSLLSGSTAQLTVTGVSTSGNNNTVLANSTLAAATPTTSYGPGNGAKALTWFISATNGVTAGSISVYCSIAGSHYYVAVTPSGTAATVAIGASGTVNTQIAVAVPCKNTYLMSTTALTAVYVDNEWSY